jgi:hypothetical protein
MEALGRSEDRSDVDPRIGFFLATSRLSVEAKTEL